MTETTTFSGTPYSGYFSGPFQAGAEVFSGAGGMHTFVGANTSTNLVEGIVATALANGFASGYLTSSEGVAPWANVYVDASVSGIGSTFYGFDLSYGGGIEGVVAHDAAARYAALQNFGGYSFSGFDVYG